MTTEKQGSSIIDQAMHYLNLCIPAVLLMFGLFLIIIGISGKFPERWKEPDMNVTSMRILYLVMGAASAAFGGWLLYHWLFGPTER